MISGAAVQRKALKQDFPLNEPSVKSVRDRVRRFCVELGLPASAIEVARLIASELATNAVRHARGQAGPAEFTLIVTLDGGKLDIAVWDHYPSPCPPLPNLADVPPEAQCGRGLAMVCEDAAGFTWTRTPVGKLVSAWIHVGETTTHHPDPSRAHLF
ncbi:ATP-binding protein [Embleya sp. MST-111070]|uniref:ATP-binding protein n=1 Tax=Embleya sp. MST-111070 TaxID=3398231 RepID=UPI003F73F3BF